MPSTTSFNYGDCLTFVLPDNGSFFLINFFIQLGLSEQPYLPFCTWSFLSFHSASRSCNGVKRSGWVLFLTVGSTTFSLAEGPMLAEHSLGSLFSLLVPGPSPGSSSILMSGSCYSHSSSSEDSSSWWFLDKIYSLNYVHSIFSDR